MGRGIIGKSAVSLLNTVIPPSLRPRPLGPTDPDHHHHLLCHRKTRGGAILTTLQITAPDCGSGGWSELEICNAFGCDTLTEGFDYDVVGGRFLPGDCNSDGSLDLSDGVCLLSHLFVGRPAELPCEGASAARMNDYNGDSNVDLSDGVAVLIYLFQGGSPHAEGIQCKVVAGCPNACN